MASKELAQIGRWALRCLLQAAELPTAAAEDASSLCPIARRHRAALRAWVLERKQEQRRSTRRAALETILRPRLVAKDRLCQHFVKTGTDLSHAYATAKDVAHMVLTTPFVEAALPGRVDFEREQEVIRLQDLVLYEPYEPAGGWAGEHFETDTDDSDSEGFAADDTDSEGFVELPTLKDVDKHTVVQQELLGEALVAWRGRFASAAAAAAAPEVPEHLRARLLEMDKVEPGVGPSRSSG